MASWARNVSGRRTGMRGFDRPAAQGSQSFSSSRKPHFSGDSMPRMRSLPSLAADLNKEAPAVHIDDAGIALHHEVAGTLRNVFTHLLRNSVDHGLAELLAEARAREAAS